MLKLPFYSDCFEEEHTSTKSVKTLDDEEDQDEGCVHDKNNNLDPSKPSQAALIEMAMNKSTKEYGARHKDLDCMDQANFIALAMERKRRKDVQEIVNQAANLLTDLFNLSPISQQKERVNLSSVLESLDLGESDPASEEILFGSSDSWDSQDVEPLSSCSPCRTSSELYNVDFSAEIMTRKSFEDLQSFADILKSEAMKRRQNQRLQHDAEDVSSLTMKCQ